VMASKPHRAPPSQKCPGGLGGSAPQAAVPVRRTGASGALDTLAQPCQTELEQDRREKLQKRARAKWLSFPLAVGLAELRSPLERSYSNAVYCASHMKQHEDGRLTTTYCGTRWCAVCNRTRTARAINRYGPTVASWTNPQFVTLTIPNVLAGELQASIKGVIRKVAGIGRAIRRTDGMPFRAVRKLEVTFSKRRSDYHPHLHLVVGGRE